MNYNDATNLALAEGKWITRPTWPGYKVGLGSVDGEEALICMDKVPDQMKWRDLWQPTEEDLSAEDYEVI